jgi:chromosome segregation ATPase
MKIKINRDAQKYEREQNVQDTEITILKQQIEDLENENRKLLENREFLKDELQLKEDLISKLEISEHKLQLKLKYLKDDLKPMDSMLL